MTNTNPTPNTYEGKVTSVVGNKIGSCCSEGNKHSHTLVKDAKVTCDGKASKLSDLKEGTPIRVTTSKDDKSMATCVESGKDIHAAV